MLFLSNLFRPILREIPTVQIEHADVEVSSSKRTSVKKDPVLVVQRSSKRSRSIVTRYNDEDVDEDTPALSVAEVKRKAKTASAYAKAASVNAIAVYTLYI